MTSLFGRNGPADHAPKSGLLADTTPDPWGVRRAEQLLASLEGIVSARVVTTALGEVSEIHVLASAGLSPKQVVRNVESALLAQLGLRVDHRKISIAQTAEARGAVPEAFAAVAPGGAALDVPAAVAAPAPAAGARVAGRAVLFERLEVTTGRGQRVTMTVTLACGEREASGSAECVDTPRARLEAAARAAAQVMDQWVPRHAISLEGAKEVLAFDRRFALVVVQAMDGRDGVLLNGSAEIRESAERAAVLAVLDAMNRWLEAAGRLATLSVAES